MSGNPLRFPRPKCLPDDLEAAMYRIMREHADNMIAKTEILTTSASLSEFEPSSYIDSMLASAHMQACLAALVEVGGKREHWMVSAWLALGRETATVAQYGMSVWDEAGRVWKTIECEADPTKSASDLPSKASGSMPVRPTRYTKTIDASGIYHVDKWVQRDVLKALRVGADMVGGRLVFYMDDPEQRRAYYQIMERSSQNLPRFR